ncbi:hypothetical protein [Streptomyces sp. NPDC059928]|uniref:hypothetical protein n=1 Tax=unclassified Streptomyces TaxID=2593676 RepID=UPI00365620F9
MPGSPPPRDEILTRADVVVGLRPPALSADSRFRRGQVVVALVDPLSTPFQVRRWADDGVTVIGLDLVPEGLDVARAVDAAASLERLAGYKAALLAADLLDRPVPGGDGPGFPEAAARVLVIGWGPAAWQAARTLHDCGRQRASGPVDHPRGAPSRSSAAMRAIAAARWAHSS